MRVLERMILPSMLFGISGSATVRRSYSNNNFCPRHNIWVLRLLTSVLPGICRVNDAFVDCRSKRRQYLLYILHGAGDRTEYTWSNVGELYEAWYMSVVIHMYMALFATSVWGCTVHDEHGSSPLHAGYPYCLLCIALWQLRAVMCINGTSSTRGCTFYEQICLVNGTMVVSGGTRKAFILVPMVVATA